MTIIYSCSSKSFETKDDLMNYLTDVENGYYHKKEINGYEYSLLYKPTDLMVSQELGTEESGAEEKEANKQKELNKLRDKYGKYLYFSLSMSRNNKELLSTMPKDRQDFGALVNQLAFGMRNKVHLYTSKKDTIEMLDYNYPRMYGMSRSTTMLFVYPKEEKYLKEEYLNFTVQDLGNYTGEVKFKVPTEKIKNQPKLQI
jgi:hypothetical protein